MVLTPGGFRVASKVGNAMEGEVIRGVARREDRERTTNLTERVENEPTALLVALRKAKTRGLPVRVACPPYKYPSLFFRYQAIAAIPAIGPTILLKRKRYRRRLGERSIKPV